MATKIPWCDETWNVTVGCTKCSPGCDNCYAEKMAHRLAHMAVRDREHGKNPGRKEVYQDVVNSDGTWNGLKSDGTWNGEIRLIEEALADPLHWRKPRFVFPCSMSDLFHPKVPFVFIDRVFDVMRDCPQHTFAVLTKRDGRMYDYYARGDRRIRPHLYRLPNVWLGVTVCNQAELNKKLPILKATPAALRFLSLEPQLGPIDLEGRLDGIGWVICGCEKLPGDRAGRGGTYRGGWEFTEWALSVLDACVEAGVAFWLKQMPMPDGRVHGTPLLGGKQWQQRPEAG